MNEISIFDLRKDLVETAARFEHEPATDVLREAHPVVMQGIQRNFDVARSPDGETWPVRKDNKPHPLLIESGALLAAAAGGAGSVNELSARSLVVGVDKDGGAQSLQGAAVHQYGYPEGHVPQREYLGLDEDHLDQVGEIIADGMLERLWQ
jgi:phage gpG-like protein